VRLGTDVRIRQPESHGSSAARRRAAEARGPCVPHRARTNTAMTRNRVDAKRTLVASVRRGACAQGKASLVPEHFDPVSWRRSLGAIPRHPHECALFVHNHRIRSDGSDEADRIRDAGQAADTHDSTCPWRGDELLVTDVDAWRGGASVDPVEPTNTAAYFRRARRPKFLLWLIGASHRPPYTTQEPQLDIVQHATVAFLDHYFRGKPLQAFTEAARIGGLTRLRELP
jgi:hypothetical protein